MMTYIKSLMTVLMLSCILGFFWFFAICCKDDNVMPALVVFIFGFPLLPVVCQKLESMDDKND